MAFGAEAYFPYSRGRASLAAGGQPSPARAGDEPRDARRLLQVASAPGEIELRSFRDLSMLLQPADLVVVNDAATLPASLRGSADGEAIEVRLLAHVCDSRFRAVLLGRGDHRVRTEHREPPPRTRVGTVLKLGGVQALVQHVSTLSPRLVELAFDVEADALWAALYANGRPVQYSHQPELLELWSVQTAYAGEPWAMEMPSAGRPLSFRVLSDLRRRGVELAGLTHAAGLSATGDPVIDAALPFPERFRIPASTVQKVHRTKARGGRVLAVGTSVVRALEGAMRAAGGRLEPGQGITNLRVREGYRLGLVDGLLTGLHSPGESHFELLSAFVPGPTIERALRVAVQHGLRSHEFGDSMLLWREPHPHEDL